MLAAIVWRGSRLCFTERDFAIFDIDAVGVLHGVNVNIARKQRDGARAVIDAACIAFVSNQKINIQIFNSHRAEVLNATNCATARVVW